MKTTYSTIMLLFIVVMDNYGQSSCITTLRYGTSDQTICMDAPISNINFNVGDNTYSPDIVTGLPQGISYQKSNIQCITTPCNEDITISGTPTAAGVFAYTLVNSGGGCIPSSPTGTITVDTTGACAIPCVAKYNTTYDSTKNEFTLNLDNANNGVSYLWDFGDGITSTLATPTHTFTKDSTYNVCLKATTAVNKNCTFCHVIGKDSLGKIYRSAGFTLKVLDNRSTGISSINNGEMQILLYPNPMINISELVFSKYVSEVSLQVINSNGQTVISKDNFSGQHFSIDLTSQSDGIYIVKIMQSSGVTQFKLIKY